MHTRAHPARATHVTHVTMPHALTITMPTLSTRRRRLRCERLEGGKVVVELVTAAVDVLAVNNVSASGVDLTDEREPVLRRKDTQSVAV